MSVQRELTETGKEASSNLESSVNNMYYILKTTVCAHVKGLHFFIYCPLQISLTAKWRSESDEEAVKANPTKKALPRPPHSPDEERQRAHKVSTNDIVIQISPI